MNNPPVLCTSDNIIRVDTARAEADRWIRYRRNPEEFMGVKIAYPVALFIYKVDMDCLDNYYNYLGITGVRAYLGLTEDPEYIGKISGDIDGYDYGLRLLLMPATQDDDFYNSPASSPVNQPSSEISAVYDFTMPCPDMCAVNNKFLPE
jgi:hypothetical protein